MKLSKNFTLEELIYSETAKNYGIKNEPDENVVYNLKKLCENVLQPIRDKFGVVIVTSGYRCSKLNKKIGGKETSQHLYGQAADIQLKNADLKEVFYFIKNNLVFDQLLLEYSKNSKWIHVSYTTLRNRKYSNDKYIV